MNAHLTSEAEALEQASRGRRRGISMPFEMDRAFYARMYGPTVGDRVRLGDTNLLVEVERDDASPGDETLWGFGKRRFRSVAGPANAPGGPEHGW